LLTCDIFGIFRWILEIFKRDRLYFLGVQGVFFGWYDCPGFLAVCVW